MDERWGARGGAGEAGGGRYRGKIERRGARD